MIVNMSGGGSAGKIVTVHVFYKSTVNVTCTNGKKTYTGITDANYNVIFKLPKGIWTITAEQDGYTSSTNVNISEDCTINISIFEAIIHVTYPAGSTCTATDGVITLNAPDTSGTWDCVVPNAGTWTVLVSEKDISVAVEITKDGQTVDLDTAHWVFRSGYGAIWPITDTTSANGITNIGTDFVELSYSSVHSSESGFYVTSAVDLSKFTKLKAKINCTGYYSTSDTSFALRMGVSRDVPTANIDSYEVSKIMVSANSADTVYTLDVSGLSGYYYVGLVGIAKAKVYDVWFE